MDAIDTCFQYIKTYHSWVHPRKSSQKKKKNNFDYYAKYI